MNKIIKQIATLTKTIKQVDEEFEKAVNEDLEWSEMRAMQADNIRADLRRVRGGLVDRLIEQFDKTKEPC